MHQKKKRKTSTLLLHSSFIFNFLCCDFVAFPSCLFYWWQLLSKCTLAAQLLLITHIRIHSLIFTVAEALTPPTHDRPNLSVLPWRSLEFLGCTATSLWEAWAHFVLVPFSRTVEPDLEIILITQDEGLDSFYFTLYFRTKILWTKDTFSLSFSFINSVRPMLWPAIQRKNL